MKKIGLAMLVSAGLVSNAMASDKVCFGSKNNDETRGAIIKVEISKKEVSIRVVKWENDYYNGTFPAYNSTVKGRDGKTYMEYKGASTDYQEVILVDQELLKTGTTGLLQFRARGEGFFNSVFVCRDDDRP
ncbi:hypothetical protein K2X30_08175 [bacterium]|jgi:hypothetical protein|nr:hypothetical protein [bacterium]